MSRAVRSQRIRSAAYGLVAATGDIYPPAAEPDIWAHRTRDRLRDGLRVRWVITAGKTGPVLRGGRAWTWGGAMVEAIAAAHRPGLAAKGGGTC